MTILIRMTVQMWSLREKKNELKWKWRKKNTKQRDKETARVVSSGTLNQLSTSQILMQFFVLYGDILLIFTKISGGVKRELPCQRIEVQPVDTCKHQHLPSTPPCLMLPPATRERTRPPRHTVAPITVYSQSAVLTQPTTFIGEVKKW